MDFDEIDFILELHAIEAIQFGSFHLKSGILSPIYIDLRLLISYPLLMKKLSQYALQRISVLAFDLICGVPDAAVPFATALSLQGNYPMILCRKQAKDYGTKKQIEGKHCTGQFCLLVEDVITSGTSIIEAAQALSAQGLRVADALVLLDREQGGRMRLKEKGITLHSLLSICDVLQVLLSEKKISQEIFQNVTSFLKGDS